MATHTWTVALRDRNFSSSERLQLRARVYERAPDMDRGSEPARFRVPELFLVEHHNRRYPLVRLCAPNSHYVPNDNEARHEMYLANLRCARK